MTIPLYQVDAFTSNAFQGNPAAVCLLETPKPDAWMQSVAAEMNLSETAFLLPKDNDFSLRWFTPLVEVDLCGHATLASAHTLWEAGRLQPAHEARFHTRSGVLTATRSGKRIELNFPSLSESAAELPPGCKEALGVSPLHVCKLGPDYCIEVKSEEIVRSLKPDFSALRRIPGRGIVVTSRSSSSQFDIVSRFFAPWVGIDEDPVTGSVHCGLGPYWSRRLDKTALKAYQASSRGGELHIRLEGDRVRLSGEAVTIVRGELLH